MANLDCRMVSLLIMHGSSPAHNIFDGIWIVDPRSAGAHNSVKSFGKGPNCTFQGLQALLLGQRRVVGIEPMSCLLESLEAVMSPLPPWSHSFKVPSIDQTRRLLDRRVWLVRGIQGTSEKDASSLAKSWSPIKPLCRHVSVAVTTLLSVARLLKRDFSSNCPHIATRISTHAFDYEIWGIVKGIADGGDHCY